MPLGPVLIDSFHGLGGSWFQRMRVLRFKAGVLVRDRVVDTHKMIEWWFRRHPETRDTFGSPSEFGGGPEGTIAWFDASEDEDWGADTWPPDFPDGQLLARQSTLRWAAGYFVRYETHV